jgi:hypothetical protein
MPSELTNLLPQENIKAFRQAYLLRLATTVVWVVTGLVLVQGIFLLPTYVYERHAIDADSAKLQTLSTTFGTEQEKEAAAESLALQGDSAHLLMLAKTPTASAALRAALAVSRPGITLTGFTFTPSAPGGVSHMQISGTSDSREDLQSFDSALGALSFVSSANLPISDYAMDTNIPFTITLTGSFPTL